MSVQVHNQIGKFYIPVFKSTAITTCGAHFLVIKPVFSKISRWNSLCHKTK